MGEARELRALKVGRQTIAYKITRIRIATRLGESLPTLRAYLRPILMQRGVSFIKLVDDIVGELFFSPMGHNGENVASSLE